MLFISARLDHSTELCIDMQHSLCSVRSSEASASYYMPAQLFRSQSYQAACTLPLRIAIYASFSRPTTF